ncbi:DUF6517 family protein [Halohasta litorea]|uniref:DUF6517 family protein n=1 Tax=Halohasta litorea TaxID=869891 RepID=A0ABD6D8F8_9EURY|nr:DUF6517 family protein [Halohasta litorea]MEA1929986.1 DUF6517 family protein [Euryarchaeota archaeon]
MYTRRRAVAMGVIGISALSGCSGAAELARGDGPLEREAARAAVSESAIAGTEYELKEATDEVIEQEISAGGQERTIIATNKLNRYAKAIDISEEGSLFGVISSPGFEFAGRTLNPVASQSNRELLELARQQFSNLTIGGSVEETERTVLGTETTVSKFEATATFGPEEYDIYIHVGSVTNEGDVIIGLGGYPQDFDDTENDTIAGFFGEIEHPV